MRSLASAGAAVAHLHPLHRDRADPGLDRALRAMAVPHERASRPSGSRRSFIAARKASASASIAWASSRRAPLRRTAVSGSSIASGWRRGTTVLSLVHGVSLLREVLAGWLPASIRRLPQTAITQFRP